MPKVRVIRLVIYNIIYVILLDEKKKLAKNKPGLVVVSHG